MKKIILGVLGIVAAVGVASGAAFALFSDTATISGVTIAAGNADIKVADYFTHPDGYADSWSGSLNIGGVYPGFVVPNSFDLWVKNFSTSPIGLNLTFRLTTLPSGWGNYLTYGAQMLIQQDGGGNTGWLSTPYWANNDVVLPGGPLTQGNERKYYIYIRVPNNYGQDEASYAGGPAVHTVIGNEIAGQSLTGSVFTLTGTQN
jgi:predicted ribosomally synthesized peptide with SipW-like signal peptide